MGHGGTFENAHHWGSAGLIQESALAAEKVILLADEIVDAEVIASDPSRVLIPGYLVAAVCHLPGGAHPSPMTGRWRRDKIRSEERRVGKECRSRWSPYH